MAEARAAINETLIPLRELLDNLPKAAALAANPADPVAAEEAIRDSLEQVFRAMEADQ